MLKELEANTRQAPSAGKRISVSLESFEQVRMLLAKFNADCDVTFVVVINDHGNVQIASSADPKPTSVAGVSRPKGAGPSTRVQLVSCEDERDPLVEEALLRYFDQTEAETAGAQFVFKSTRTEFDHRTVGFLIKKRSGGGDETGQPGGLKSFEIKRLFDALVYVSLQYCLSPRQSDTFFGLAPDLLSRAAAQLFLQKLSQEATGRMNYGLYELCCDLAAAQYEGRAGAGYIVLAKRGSANIKPSIEFRRPIHLSHNTGVRKLIEMASQQFALLFDGDYFYGFVDFDQIQDCHHILFKGRGIWTMQRGEQLLAMVSYGSPVEVDRILTKEIFQAHVKKCLPMVEQDGLETLWDIAIIAAEQPVGTNILFTPGARHEAQRLSSQCIPIRPVALTAEVTTQLTAIDGTLIADIDGNVHAVGAIMDGSSTPSGTWQRGGRYNSAANYVTSSKYPALIFIVSQDGYVDIVPPMNPKGDKWSMKRYLKLNSTAI
ncbi:MAG: diadenylate cyclase [Alphaproteobacteria bacterium]|nr:diadenylate cyclase [Alphaproteobacteria bacterium]